MEVNQEVTSGAGTPQNSVSHTEKQEDKAFMALKAEKKKLQMELEEVRKTLQAKQDAELKETNNFKTLFEQREQQLSEERAKREELEKAVFNSLKRAAFDQEIGGGLARQEYYSHVDFDSIAFNPETRSVDRESAKIVAQGFAKTFPELIGVKMGKMPNLSPGQADHSVNLDKMTASELEQYIKRLHSEGKL